MKTVSCTECPRHFTKGNTSQAEAALRMHVGRVHSKNIIARGGHAVLRQQGNRLLPVGTRGSRAHLKPEEANAIVDFIRANRQSYPTKTACFKAAIDTVGLNGRLLGSSTAVDRYFKKADIAAPTAAPAAIRQKRKYTRKADKQAVAVDVHINFCPHCGCNLKAIAMGMAMASLK